MYVSYRAYYKHLIVFHHSDRCSSVCPVYVLVFASATFTSFCTTLCTRCGEFVKGKVWNSKTNCSVFKDPLLIAHVFHTSAIRAISGAFRHRCFYIISKLWIYFYICITSNGQLLALPVIHVQS